MLELCWSPQPNQRPNINNVLQCLERVLNLPELPSTVVGQEMEKGDNWDSVNDSSGMFSHSIHSVTFHGLSVFNCNRHISAY